MSQTYTATFGVNNNTLQLTITETVNASANTSTIAYDVKVIGDGYDVSNNNYLTLTLNGNNLYNANPGRVVNGTTITNGSFTFSHNSDGTGSFAVYCQYSTILSSSGSVTATISNTYTCTTIARTSTVSASNGTMGTAQTLTVTRASSSYTHTITYTVGSATGTIVTKSSSTSISWTPPVSLASQSTNTTTIKCTLKCTTYNGNTSLGTTATTITLTIPSSVKPSSTSVTATNVGTGLNGLWLQNASKLRLVWVVSTTNDYGATIDSATITVGGRTLSKTISRNGTTTTITASDTTLTTAGTISYTGTATDSRGRTVTMSGSITVKAYSAPGISTAAVERCTSDGTASSSGTYAKVTATITYSTVDGNNSLSGTIGYLGTTAAISSASVSQVIGGGGFDTDNSYTITLSVTDTVGNGASTSLQLPSQFVLMDFYQDGTGMAIGKVAETSNLLDIALPTTFNESIQELKPAIPMAHSNASAGTAGYICLAEITVLKQYANAPIQLEFAQRGACLGTVIFTLQNVTTLFPYTLFAVQIGWLKGVYYKWTDTSTCRVFDIYLEKSEAYDDISLLDIKLPYYMRDKVAIDLVNIFTSDTTDFHGPLPTYRPTYVET